MPRRLALACLAFAIAMPMPFAPAAFAQSQKADPLRAAIEAPERSASNRARDAFRHPAETLAFFGVKPTDSMVEIWPGGGWYTEILAPYAIKGGGSYTAAATKRGIGTLEKLAAAQPDIYGKAKVVAFPRPDPSATGVAPGSADVVLTFRNVHNWLMGDEPFAEDAFRQMFAMLKPGGTLGVVEHRLPEDRPDGDELKSGYVKVSTVKRLAAQAGFKLVAESEINANPRDSADHPSGVWTLPPVLRLKDQDKDKYLAIGESDRMTLKFVKPATMTPAPERGR